MQGLSSQVGQGKAGKTVSSDYELWCRKHRLDPQDTASMVAYEGEWGELPEQGRWEDDMERQREENRR